MSSLRRSGRIPKEVPILLLGTDTSGCVFSEKTHTLVLSRHGAGVVSSNKFAQDEVLTMRLPDSGREADIRLVGRLGEDPRGYVYGVAFCDPEIDFWQMEFPPPSQADAQPANVALECTICGSRSLVEQCEVESDVFLVSQSILRFCDSCGQTTPWKQAAGDVAAKPAKIAQPPKIAASPETKTAPLPPAAPGSSAYTADALDDLVTDGFALPQPPPAPEPIATAVQDPSAKSKPAAPASALSAGGKPNRRRHVRTRVSFQACVRVNHLNEEIVECENVSKGGLCFRCRKRYPKGAAIEVAVPYSPGQQAIFVPAQIRHVEELWGDLYRYGVAYA